MEGRESYFGSFKRCYWLIFNNEERWVCNYKNPKAPEEKKRYEPDLNELAGLELIN